MPAHAAAAGSELDVNNVAMTARKALITTTAEATDI